MWRKTKTDAEGPERSGPTSVTDLTWLEPSSPGLTPGVCDGVARLTRALGEFRAAHTAPTLSATRLINPLLDLWGIASAIDHSIAAPIEALLTTLIARSITTPSEIIAYLDGVEEAAGRLSNHAVVMRMV